MKGSFGKKLGNTQFPDKEGKLIGVVAVWAPDNYVSQVKTDGYESCQLAFEECSELTLKDPQLGHLKANNLPHLRYFKEIRDMKGFKIGDKLNLSTFFKEGERINATAIPQKSKGKGGSKGKGNAGVHKRHGYSLNKEGHGRGYPHRLIGSMAGGRGTGQRIFKGKKMPGRMGGEQVTIRNLLIVAIFPEQQVILLKGSLPGTKKRTIIKLWK